MNGVNVKITTSFDVKIVNMEDVSISDKLSDAVYRYRVEDKVFELIG